jgi:hypothetical protein
MDKLLEELMSMKMMRCSLKSPLEECLAPLVKRISSTFTAKR